MIHRPRRLRRTDAIRSLVRETRLAPENFVLPLFVCPGTGVRREIASMPGVYNLSVDEVTNEVSAAYDMGVRSIILFGLPESKDELASGAYAEDGIVQRAIRSIRQSSPEIIIMADTCLCEYTSHGHCGVVRGQEILNDESLDLLAQTALSQAAAGADVHRAHLRDRGDVGVVRHVQLDRRDSRRESFQFLANFRFARPGDDFTGACFGQHCHERPSEAAARAAYQHPFAFNLHARLLPPRIAFAIARVDKVQGRPGPKRRSVRYSSTTVP